MSPTSFIREALEFYRWLFSGIWRAVSMPFRLLRQVGAGGSNPLRFRPDLWALENDAKMAMDVRPEVVVLDKPWGLLLWRGGRKAVGMSFIDIIFLRIEMHFDSRVMRVSTSSKLFFATLGKSYGIDFAEIQVPEQIEFPGVFPEVLFNTSGISFTVKGSGGTKDEQRRIPLARRGMWWPTSLNRWESTKTIAGEAYSSAFKALSRWAATNKWA